MKVQTRKYDLNLYVVDGVLKLLAHEVQKQGEHWSTGSKYHTALKLNLSRKNRPIWQAILDFYEEEELYSELDSWWLTPVNGEGFDSPGYKCSDSELDNMPEIMKIALSCLPEYEMEV